MAPNGKLLIELKRKKSDKVVKMKIYDKWTRVSKNRGERAARINREKLLNGRQLNIKLIYFEKSNVDSKLWEQILSDLRQNKSKKKLLTTTNVINKSDSNDGGAS